MFVQFVADQNQAPQVDAEGYTIAPADRHKPLWDEPNENIPSTSSRGMAVGAAAGAAGVALPSAIFASQRSSSPGLMQDNQSTSSSSIGDAAPRLNLAMATAPIKESDDERQAALAKMQQTLSMQPQPPMRRSTIARGRREARHTMQASAADAAPLPPAHMAALARMGDEERLTDESSLAPRLDMARRRSASSVSTSSRNPFDSPGLGAPSPGLDAPSSGLERAPSPRVTVPTAAISGLAAGGAGAAALSAHAQSNGTTPALPAAAAAPSSPPPTSPTAPISPTASLAGAGSQAPPMPPRPSLSSSTATSGLNAAITETVHALIRQSQVVQTTVNGEIRLSLAASPNQPLPPPGSAIHIRLTEFDNLESISPNPAFLAQVPDAPGEYYLNTDAVAQATAQPQDGNPQGPVLFQYQVLVANPDVAPLALKPAFQVKGGETRMILHYRVSPGAGVADLNLAVQFPREPEVTTTQSKPVSGSWTDTPDGNRAISYRVPPQEGVDNKIIARFITGGQLAPTNVDAHFACPGRILSDIGLETVEDAQSAPGWSFADVYRATVSGKYSGEPSVNP